MDYWLAVLLWIIAGIVAVAWVAISFIVAVAVACALFLSAHVKSFRRK